MFNRIHFCLGTVVSVYEGRGAMVRAPRFANVTACRAVLNYRLV